MRQPGGSTQDPRPPRSHRPPRRDWRALLRDLSGMVPWPPRPRGTPTQSQVLQHVLGYIHHLQRSLSRARGGAGPPAATTEATAGATRGPPRQLLVPYKEEEEEVGGGGGSPWLGPTGPYWEALVWEGGVPLSPPPRRGGLLGLSPSLLASPPPPGPPEDVARALFADVCLSPQAPSAASAVTPGVASSGTGRGQRGHWGQGPKKKKCVNGFIMFCRLHRKHLLSATPGLASTAATRELAQLWRSLSPDQRRPYCLRARRFSRLHDRVMRQDRDSGDNGGDNGDSDPPAPLPLLLATRGGDLLSP